MKSNSLHQIQAKKKKIESSQVLASNTGKEEKDREFTENQYFKLVSDLTACVNKLKAAPSQIRSSSSSEGSCSAPIAVRLPDIKISQFSGHIRDFQSFIELFDALIVKNETLTDIQKLVYLKSYLRGESLQLIDSLPIINENFVIALNILKKRYENKFAIINSYLQAIFDCNNISKCKSDTLRELITTIQKNILSLQNLNLTSENLFDLTLIFILKKKLDFQSAKAYESERNHDEIPTLNHFLKFLEKRAVILENVEISSPKTTRKNFSSHSTMHEATSNRQFQLICIYCNKEGHKIYTCSEFKDMSHSAKLQFIRAKNLCINCFGKHNLKECKSSKKCSFCSKSHNSLMHIKIGENQHSPPMTSSKRHSHSLYNNGSNSQPNSYAGNHSSLISSNSSYLDNTAHFQNGNNASFPLDSNSNLQTRSLDIQPVQENSGMYLDNTAHVQNGNNSSSHLDSNSNLQTRSLDTQPVSGYSNFQGPSRNFTENNPTANNHSANHSVQSVKHSHILLGTAKVTLLGINANFCIAKILLDTGSQNSFIVEKLVNK
uniref:Uncharacterized protein LOC114339688 n=1 Tax=Diabrotica virgifera virgifera TaxID=50390 RepID=A0A6P7GAH9_DIAVI